MTFLGSATSEWKPKSKVRPEIELKIISSFLILVRLESTQSKFSNYLLTLTWKISRRRIVPRGCPEGRMYLFLGSSRLFWACHDSFEIGYSFRNNRGGELKRLRKLRLLPDRSVETFLIIYTNCQLLSIIVGRNLRR